MKWMDMHCDTVSELFRKRSEGTLWKNKLCVDIERLKKSDSVAQFFACYVNAAEYPGWEEAFDAAEKLIQSVHEEEAKEFCVAGSGAEVFRDTYGKRRLCAERKSRTGGTAL